MNRLRPAIRPVGIWLLIVAALFSCGCAEELGPVPMPVARVQGRVTVGDRPITGGWIEFVPVGQTIGKLRSAHVGADGSFDADGIAVGENAIRLVNEQVDLTPALRLFGTFGSPIRRVIRAAPSGPVTINLVEEAVRFQEANRRRAASAPTAGTQEVP